MKYNILCEFFPETSGVTGWKPRKPLGRLGQLRDALIV